MRLNLSNFRNGHNKKWWQAYSPLIVLSGERLKSHSHLHIFTSRRGWHSPLVLDISHDAHVTFCDSEQTISGVRKLISTVKYGASHKKLLYTLHRSKVIDNSVIFWLDESHWEVHRWYRHTHWWFILSSERQHLFRNRCSCVTAGKDVKKYSTLETVSLAIHRVVDVASLFLSAFKTTAGGSWRTGSAVVYLALWLKMSQL